MPLVDFLTTIVERSENGPYMKESEYDLTLAKKSWV